MTNHFVYSESGKTFFEIPSDWRVVSDERKKKETEDFTGNSIQEALEKPIDAKRLSKSVSDKTRVAIVVDDYTRPTPVSKILPEIIRELKAGGVKDNSIEIVMALGTHQPIPENAFIEHVGKDVFRKHNVTQHDCFDNELVPVTTFASGTEVKVNPVVAKADLAIGVGSILPHPMNGFGGGAKTLFPGVANYEAIREHHLMYTPELDAAYIGNVQDNPFRSEVLRIAKETNFRFIVNCIYNSKEELVDIVAGDVHGAHGAGIERSLALYGIDVPVESDVTITSSFPYVSGPQVIKPLIPCSLLTTKFGGTVIMLASCKDGMPEVMLKTFDRLFEKGIDDRGSFAIEMFKSGKLFVDGAIDFNCAIFYCLLCSARNRIVIVSDDLDNKTVERMGFQFEKSIEGALEKEREKRDGVTVNVFPIGGLFLPLSKRVPNLGV